MAAGAFLACQDLQAPGEPTAPHFRHYAPHITIHPSGDMSGVTDATALEAALNAAVPGQVIQLAEGTYYMNRTLVAPVGFGGTLRGAGGNKTTIVGVGSAEAPYGNAQINFPFGPGLINGSAVVFFPQPSGYVRVSDFAVTLPEGFVTEPNDLGTTALLSVFTVALGSDECSTSFRNLRVQGTKVSPSDPFFWFYQPVWGIAVVGLDEAFPGALSGGNHVVKNSEFSKVGLEATVHQFFKDARIMITNNTFSEVKQLLLRFLDGANVLITENTLKTVSLSAITVTQEGFDVPGKRSDVLIRGNEITTDGFTGIEVGWLGDQARDKQDFNLVIDKNTITKGDDPFQAFPNRAGIQIANGEENALVRNNTIRGHGDFAILADHVNNSVFVGNHLMDFTPAEAHCGLIDSNDNKLFLEGDETVLDQGSGNIIIRGWKKDVL
jgi:hypothetical protein